MRRGRSGFAVTVAVCVGLLTGCTAAAPRLATSIDRRLELSEWVEIEGRWDVGYGDGEGGALLQPALDIDWSDESEDPREPAEAVWVDAASGEQVWSRDDVGGVISGTEGAVVVAVGSGRDRTIESLDVATGETLWSIPGTDVGECEGWYGIDRGGDGDDAPWVLAGPAECGDRSRTVLARLDPETGAAEPLLEGSGGLEVARVDDVLAVLTWDQDGASLRVVDLESDQVTRTIEIDASTLLEGSSLGGRQRLDFFTSVELRDAVTDGAIWLNVRRDDPDDDYSYSTVMNEFLIDLEEGTVQRTANTLCVYRGTQDAWYRQWSTEVPFCLAFGIGDSSATVTVGLGDDATSWHLPILGDDPNWQRADCEIAENEDRPLLLAPAGDAAVRAYDLRTGDVVWSLAAGDPGAQLAEAANPDADELVVLTEDAGDQMLRVLRLCTGELVSERAVEGGFLDGGYLPAAADVVTVPLEDTTLIARYAVVYGSQASSDDG